LAHVNAAAQTFFDDETSLLSPARSARTGLDRACSIDDTPQRIAGRFGDLFYDIEDLAAEFRSYRDHLSYDPDRLEAVEERLNLLYRLKKKYLPRAGTGPSPEEDILAWKAEAEAELVSLKNIEENRDKLKDKIAGLEKDILARSAALTAKRREGAIKLASGITAILGRLGMPNASFAAAVLPRGRNAEGEKNASLVCGPWGADDVEFMISANAGEPLKELARIASGGELSRVMLAIKTMISDTPFGGPNGEPNNGPNGEPLNKPSGSFDSTPETLIFDEIDTGIGGEVAISVGEYLAQMGKRKQIFCVTHLAVIAVRCDNQFKVEKKVIPAEMNGQSSAGGQPNTGSQSNAGGQPDNNHDRTITTVTRLEFNERRQEIARMLAGGDGEAALAHADELLAKYKAGK
ncbi:MAG: hypothetical protein FWD78_16740, partial [Treponema sp.]|nr:hypothetical protein [Treponema sp.]